MKRVVIVAGGTGTIGGAVCAALAQRGKGVVAVCRHQPAPCDQVCGVDYYARDIMENHAAETLLAYIRCKNYEVEGLVMSLSSETSCEAPKGLVHLGAEIDLVETVVPKMIGGSVVMLSSTAARLPFALGTSRFYAGAKDADYLIYNTTIDGEVGSLDDLYDLCLTDMLCAACHH